LAATRETCDEEEEERRNFRITAIRVVLVAIVMAVLLGVAQGASNLLDIVGSCLETAVGAGLGLTAGRMWVPRRWYHDKLWAAALAITASVTLPITIIVVAWHVLIDHRALTPGLLLNVLPSVFGTSLVMTAVAFLVRRPSTQTHAAPASAAPPKFLARLPEKLRGAELFAVEAEDHYLRLHTSLGQDLILMRLADAIVELEGLEGAQTHRSWWVAKAAVASAERADGRATLTLKDGAEAPVSRGFARELRAAGWF
jgi:hypothetical protein